MTFELNPEKCAEPEKFKYISMKVKKLKQGGRVKRLIQFVDISSKRLLSDMEGKQALLTLVNATVSHELRNPLNSLIA